MHYLIYGHKGWIGQTISGIIQKSGCYVNYGNRVTDFETTLIELQTKKPDRIVCCIGRTFGPDNNTVDYLESPDKIQENLFCNLYAPLLVAEASFKLGIPMLYIGTGCIFEYDTLHPIGGPGFKEEDQPNFWGSAYSAVKGKTDFLIGLNRPNVINARIRMPIGKDHHVRDFITKILNYKNIISIPNSMTILDDILPTLIGLLHQGKFSGTLNACNPNVVDHQFILENYQRIHNIKLSYKLVSNDVKLTQGKRSNNYLETTKIERLVKFLDKDIKEKFKVPEKLKPISERIIEIIKGRIGNEIMISPVRKDVKKILVTGGCGFIGSHFIEEWTRNNPNDFIVNIDRIDICASEKNVPTFKNYKLIKGDIQNSDLINFILDEYKITHVIHFAAQTHVDHSFSNSIEFTKSNILGTHTLLECVRKYGKLELFVHISTDEVYGEIKEGSFNELSILEPSNPYAATKAGAEFLVRSFGTSYKIPYIITRGNNVFGSRQYPDKVIPKFITQMMKGEKMTIHGNGHNVRNYIYVKDVVNAISIILTKGKIGEIYNIGGDTELDVLQIAKYVHSYFEERSFEDCVQFVSDRNFNDCRYSVESTKLRDLGWKQKTSFIDGFRNTVIWYKENLNYWL